MGEIAIKLTASKSVCLMVGMKRSASAAAIQGVRTAGERLHGSLGVIAIDLRGRLAAVHNTRFMPWAFATVKMRKPEAKKRGRMAFALK